MINGPDDKDVMDQIAKNAPGQALLGDFADAMDDAVHGRQRGTPEPDDAVPQQQTIASGIPASGV